MTMTPKPRCATPRAAAIDEEWLDDMVKKLFRALETQLEKVTAKAGAESAAARAANARTLSSLERERAAARERKVARHDDDTRAALERRMDKLLAATDAPGLPAKPDKG